MINKNQRIIIWIGILVFLILSLVPPWYMIEEKGGLPYSKAAGYGFIFSPPKEADTIDFVRLQIQWLMVTIITIALVINTKDQESSSAQSQTGKGGVKQTKTASGVLAQRITNPRLRRLLAKLTPQKTPALARWLTPRRFYTLLVILLVLMVLSLIGLSPQFRKFSIKNYFVDKQQIRLMIADVDLVGSYWAHTEIIRATAFSPEGDLLATASYDKTLKLWDLKSDTELRTFSGHVDRVRTLDYSRNGKYLVSGSDDNTVKLWDVKTGEEIRTFEGHTDKIRSVIFSPNTKLIASAGADMSIKIWDLNGGYEIRSLTGHTDEVWSIKFSPEGKFLASGSGDKTVRLWEVNTGKQLKQWGGREGKVITIDYSQDGTLLAIGSGTQNQHGWTDGLLEILNLEKNEVLKTIKGSRSSTFISVGFHPSGKLLASGSNDNTARIWNVQTGQELLNLREHMNLVSCVRFNPNGTFLATSSGDRQATQGEIRIWGPFK